MDQKETVKNGEGGCFICVGNSRRVPIKKSSPLRHMALSAIRMKKATDKCWAGNPAWG